MCGRYVVTNPVAKTAKIVKKAINVDNTENYNAHPQQNLPVLKKYINGNTLELLKWGIIPTWAKKKDFRPLINARIETINEKISFKKLIKIQRCVVVADGFYEWKRENKIKIPHFFFRKDKKTIFFAGIYQDDQFCLITEKSDVNISKIHDRQPVIIDEKDIKSYLNIEFEAVNILNDRNRPNLEFYEISKDVNKPNNNNISLIQKV